MYPSIKKLALVLALAAGVSPMFQAHAEELKFVYFDTYEPFSFGEQAAVKGMLIDVVTEAVSRVEGGYTATHTGLPWKRAQAMVEAGEADGFITTATAERKAYATFTEHQGLLGRRALFYAPENPKREAIEAAASVEDVAAFTVVDYLGNGWAKSNLEDKGVKINWVSDSETVLKVVAAQRGDVHVGNYDTGRITRDKLGMTNEVAAKPIDFMAPVEMRIGIRNSYPNAAELVGKLNTALEAMHADGTVEAIMAKY